MKTWMLLLGVPVLSSGLACACASQAPQESRYPAASQPTPGPPPLAQNQGPLNPVPLEWTPSALAELSSEATARSSFTLDRTMLGLAAGLVPDSESETRQAINKLDGVSVHVLRFDPGGIADEGQVDAIRAAYHLRGWKHLVTTTRAGGPVHSGSTDVWLVLDGTNVRGAVVLAETPASLTLVTVAGNLSPVDLMHLRGHFGIPRFEGDNLKDARVR